MPVVAFYTQCKEETGNTISSLALATYMGIEKNHKILYISTALNDETVNEAMWPSQNNKKRSGLFGPNTSSISTNGVEGLDRVIRSNKISPDLITDYTKAVLKNRYEILLGYNGSEDQYKEIQKQYKQIINMASKCYDTVIVDIDKKLDLKTKVEILNESNVVIAMTNQKLKNIEALMKTISEGTVLKPKYTLITFGKYDEKVKYNAKNTSRNILRQKKIINTIPYNSVLFEAVQEGRMIDVFLKFLTLKGKDENTFFIDEIRRFEETIYNKIMELRMAGEQI